MNEDANHKHPPGTDADLAASVFDFVNDFLDDRAAGILRELADYQRRFPGADAAIAAEYHRLTQPESVKTGQSGENQFVQHYKLIRELGRGGQGSVWLAEDQNLHRPVALKLLNSWLIAGERLARFQREAESIARLEHEGLAVVYEAQMESDPPFIAMRFVEGEDLSSCLSQRAAHPVDFLPIASPQDLRSALHFFERAARALHVAHEAGVVHRDIKPGNILIAAPGRPVITDFGLARDEYSPGEETLTQDGEIFGTPAYMSPEQVSGRAEDIDRRTDVWALGATLFETLCGRTPFQGKGQLGLARAILEDPLSIPRVCAGDSPLPTDVRIVLQTAMERDLGRRYPTALAMAEDLRRIREFEPIQARPAGPWLRLRRWARREPAWATALGLLLITLIAGLIASQITIDRIQGLLRDKEVALDQERALRYVRQVPQLLKDSPSLALAAGLEAVSMHDSWITRSSLYGPLENLTLRARGRLATSNVAWSGQFLGDGSRAIVASGLGGLALVDSEDGSPITTRIVDGLGESAAPDIRHVLEVPGQNAVVIGTSDGRVLRLSLPDLQTEWQASLSKAVILSLALTPDGQSVLGLTSDMGAAKIHLRDGSIPLTIPVPMESASLVLALPNGQQVLTTGDSSRNHAVGPSPRATLWDSNSGLPIREFSHSSAVRCAAIRPDGKYLATGTLKGQVYLWNLMDPKEEPLVRSASGPLECLGFSPDGTWLAAGGELGAWTWNGQETTNRALSGHEGKVVDLKFSQDGEELATCSWDTIVRIFSPAGGPAIRKNRAGYRPLLVAWSRQGHRLMSAGIGVDFSLWNANTPAQARRFRGLGAPLEWAEFTSDGSGALALDTAGRLLMFETPLIDPSDHLQKPPVVLVDHERGPVTCAAARNAPFAASGGVGGVVFLHDLRDQTIVSSNRGWVQGIRHLAIRPDGQQVAIVDGIGRLGLWDGGEGIARRLPGVEQQIQRVSFDASGKLLAAGDALGQVLVWNTTSGELLHRLNAGWSLDSPERHPVIDLAFDPEGETVHAACSPWWTLSWDLTRADRSGEREKRMALHWLKALPRKMGVLTCGTGVGTISIGQSDRLARPATQHSAPLTCLDANGNGEWAATGCEDGSILVWNVESGATLARYDQHEGPVRHIAFSPIAGDDRVLSAGEDGTLALWLVNPTALAKLRAPYGLSQRLRDRFDSWGLASESE